MNAVQFCDKYGDKYASKIKEWYAAGYLGNATKDEKTGRYNIPDDIPLPFSAHKNVSTIQTLTRDILTAALNCNSIFPSMYPKIPSETFDRVLQDCIDSHLVRISRTGNGDPFLELQIDGIRFLSDYTEKQRKILLNRLYKLVTGGLSFLGALIQLGVLK